MCYCLSRLQEFLYKAIIGLHYWLLRNKTNVKVFSTAAFLIVCGLCSLVYTTFFEKHYFVIFISIPLFFIIVIIILCGIPFPFRKIDENQFDYSFESSYGFLGMDFDIYKFTEDTKHFIISCCSVSFIAILIIIFGQSPLDLISLFISIAGLFFLFCGGCFFAYVNFPPVCIEDTGSEDEDF